MKFSLRFFSIFILVTMSLGFISSSQDSKDNPSPMNRTGQKKPENVSTTNWDTFVNQYIESYFQTHPEIAVVMGRHEFDGQLSDLSRKGIATEMDRLHQARIKALAFLPDSLTEDQRFEQEYVLAQIDRDLFWLETAQWPFKNPYFYQWILDPNVYISREYAPLPQRMKAFTKYAQALPTAIHQMLSNLQTPLPRTYLQIGRILAGGLVTYIQNDVPAVFAKVDDASLQSEFHAAVDKAITALKELDSWLEKQDAQATDQFALGSELFSQMLRDTERLDISLEKLEEIGRRDLNRNLAALKQACAEFAPGESIPSCIAKVNAHKPKPGPVEAAQKQLPDLKQSIIDHKIVTIPGPEESLVKESPPYQRWNAAYIDIPGPYEKGLPAFYYITPPDPAWSAQEQNEYIPSAAGLLFTTVHEVWPGHFLNFMHVNRCRSKIGRVFSSYAFSEGWAHYTEEMMWECGLGNNEPELHIGQLLEALLRNVRFLSAMGLHTRGMTVEESEKMFRESAFQDPATARQQAARGTFDPEYLKYTMGKLLILKLREDWCASRGGQSARGEFHDRFLSYGSPPIPLVRKAMLGTGSGALF